MPEPRRLPDGSTTSLTASQLSAPSIAAGQIAQASLPSEFSSTSVIDEGEGVTTRKPASFGGQVMDGVQSLLDLVGIVDPFGIADIANAGISGIRAVTDPERRGEHLMNAGISLVSAVPFGDFAKAGKFRQFSRVAESAHEMFRGARASGAGFAEGGKVPTAADVVQGTKLPPIPKGSFAHLFKPRPKFVPAPRPEGISVAEWNQRETLRSWNEHTDWTPKLHVAKPSSPTPPDLPVLEYDDVVKPVVEASAKADSYQGPRSLWETMRKAGADKSLGETEERDSPFVKRLTESLTKHLGLSGAPAGTDDGSNLADVAAAMRANAADAPQPHKPPRGKSLWSLMGQKAPGFAEGGHVSGASMRLRPPAPEDTVPAMLKPGEVVLNEGQQESVARQAGAHKSEVFSKAKVPGFAGGGVVPAAPIGFAAGGSVPSPTPSGGGLQDMVVVIQNLRRSFSGLTQTIGTLDKTVHGVDANLAHYSTTLAIAEGQLQIGQTVRNLRLAAATEKTGAAAMYAQNRALDARQPWTQFTTNVGNDFSRAGSEISRGWNEGLSGLAEIAKSLELDQTAGLGADSIRELVDAVAAIASAVKMGVDELHLLEPIHFIIKDVNTGITSVKEAAIAIRTLIEKVTDPTGEKRKAREAAEEKERRAMPVHVQAMLQNMNQVQQDEFQKRWLGK